MGRAEKTIFEALQIFPKKLINLKIIKCQRTTTYQHMYHYYYDNMQIKEESTNETGRYVQHAVHKSTVLRLVESFNCLLLYVFVFIQPCKKSQQF